MEEHKDEKIISDSERRMFLSHFTDFRGGDEEFLFIHAPKQSNDIEGKSFQDYYDFLQELYGFSEDAPHLPIDDYVYGKDYLRKRARNYGFPVTNIDRITR